MIFIMRGKRRGHGERESDTPGDDEEMKELEKQQEKPLIF